MKTINKNPKKQSDIDKALAKAGGADENDLRTASQTDVFSDTVKGEKDEELDAEERQRKHRKSKAGNR